MKFSNCFKEILPSYMAFPMIVPSQPNSANFGNSSKVEIPPEAISLTFSQEVKISLYKSKLGPSSIPSLAISVQITYEIPSF